MTMSRPAGGRRLVPEEFGTKNQRFKRKRRELIRDSPDEASILSAHAAVLG
jgi:hypothetical protein